MKFHIYVFIIIAANIGFLIHALLFRLEIWKERKWWIILNVMILVIITYFLFRDSTDTSGFVNYKTGK